MAMDYKFNNKFWKEKRHQIKKDEEEKKNQYGDPRFWKFKYDAKTKKGSALVRFLPDKTATPYKQFFSHWFEYQSPKGMQKYVEKCATSVGGECPICEDNKTLYNSAHEADKAVAKERKRHYHYVSNILVLKDPTNTDNEGKVFLFDFGPQLFKNYKEAMFGEDDDDDVNEEELYVPCDFEEGADFLLKSTLKTGTNWVTYEPSKFKSQGRIFDDLEDEEWEKAVNAVMEKTYSLDEWDNEENFPTASSVKTKLAYIFGEAAPAAEEVDNAVEEVDDPEMEVDTDTDAQPIDEDNEVQSQEDQSDEDFINGLVDG